MTQKTNNPFLVSGYNGPDYFCDREIETADLISALKNGRNIALISSRCIGKTGLILKDEKNNYLVYDRFFSTWLERT